MDAGWLSDGAKNWGAGHPGRQSIKIRATQVVSANRAAKFASALAQFGRAGRTEPLRMDWDLPRLFGKFPAGCRRLLLWTHLGQHTSHRAQAQGKSIFTVTVVSAHHFSTRFPAFFAAKKFLELFTISPRIHSWIWVRILVQLRVGSIWPWIGSRPSPRR